MGDQNKELDQSLVVKGDGQDNDDDGWGYTPPRASINLIYFVSLSMSIEYALLMPTVNQYVTFLGGTTAFLGIVLSAFSVTRTMFFVIFGVWSDKRDMKEPFMFAFAIVILGDLLYAFADTTCVNDWTEDAVCEEAPGLIKSAGLYLMLAGRLICGIGGANTTLTQAYFARAASPSQRTKMLALANGCQMIGIMLGPAMSIMFVHIDIGIGDFRLYQNTSPGYVMALVNLFSLVAFYLWFENPPKDKVKVKYDKEFYGKVHKVIWRKGGWYCLLCNFIMGFEITGLETGLTPITKTWGWGPTANSAFFAGIAVVALSSIVTTIILDKRGYSGRVLIFGAFVCMAVSFVVGFIFCGPATIPKLGFGLFGLLFIFGVMLMNAPNTAIYSLMIGDYDKGVFMGFSQIVLGLSRICGPLAPALTFKTGASPHWLFMSVLCLPFAAGLIALPFVWYQLDYGDDKDVLQEDQLITKEWKTETITVPGAWAGTTFSYERRASRASVSSAVTRLDISPRESEIQ